MTSRLCELLPTVPGKLEGIVGWEPQAEGQPIVTTQCQVCGVTVRDVGVIALRAICFRNKPYGTAPYRRCNECIEDERHPEDRG